jgi:GNAT superfamily N-acetyltransferase
VYPKEFRMSASQSVSTAELRGFVDLNFARRLEKAETATADRVRVLRQVCADATMELIAGGTAIFGGPDYPANHIVGMGLYGPVSLHDVECVEEFYRSRGVPCEIVLSPLADPSLRELLAPRGYRITEFNSVLIRPLAGCELVPPGDGITVERVTEETGPTWDHVIARGFAEYGPVPENLFASFATLPDSLNFLARVGDEPVGGGMGTVMREAGIAALFGTATTRQFRGRGVQTALINRRLWEAAQQGCEYAVVSTMPGSGSQRNMERRGFRVAYTKIVMVRSWPEVAGEGVADGH